MRISILYTDCRGGWPHGVCAFANVCGYISTTIWFIVLAPQIWKNWKRQSVEGLSILWATANFTASIVNCFFVFSITLPLYLKISAVYMPVLEFLILVQFWFYSKHHIQWVSRKLRPRKHRPQTSDLENPDLQNTDLENPDLENTDLENPDLAI